MDRILQSLNILQDDSAEFSARTKVADHEIVVRLRALKKQEATLVELRERVRLTDMLLGLLERRTALRQELAGVEERLRNAVENARFWEEQASRSERDRALWKQLYEDAAMHYQEPREDIDSRQSLIS